MLLLSYKNDARSRERQYSMTWITESVFPTGPLAYIQRAERLVRKFQPHWIVGFSDTYYGILAVRLGKRYHIGSVIDAYDNYESYIHWLKPLHHLWRKALSQATLVTAAGPHLAQFLGSFRQDKKVQVIPMASDPGFKPLDKVECRQKLGLPFDKKIIGYCGSLYRNRGIDTMMEAFDILIHENPDVQIIASGRREKGVRLSDGFKHLGYLPDDLVPIFVNSLDVMLVMNRQSSFGNFSYPVKLYEAINCHIPVVATDTRGARWILRNREQFLANPEDPYDLASKMERLLSLGCFDYAEEDTWEKSAKLFEDALQGERIIHDNS